MLSREGPRARVFPSTATERPVVHTFARMTEYVVGAVAPIDKDCIEYRTENGQHACVRAVLTFPPLDAVAVNLPNCPLPHPVTSRRSLILPVRTHVAQRRWLPTIRRADPALPAAVRSGCAAPASN